MSNNLKRLDDMHMDGWAIKDPEGTLWLRPCRGSGGWALWQTQRKAEEAAAERARHWSNRNRGLWQTVKVSIECKEQSGL